MLGIKESTVQTALLRERPLTLSKCIDLCKASENATQHHQAMKTDPIHKLSATRSKPKGTIQKPPAPRRVALQARHVFSAPTLIRSAKNCAQHTAKHVKSVGRKTTLLSSALSLVARSTSLKTSQTMTLTLKLRFGSTLFITQPVMTSSAPCSLIRRR